MAIFPFKDVATMMPVAIVPSPAGSGEAVLAWPPVVPSAIVPFVPGFLLRVPLPPDSWRLVAFLTPFANFRMVLVLLDELETFLLR